MIGRGGPETPATNLHANAIRKGRDGNWWRVRRGAWERITTRRHLKRRLKRRATQKQLRAATKEGMIKVMYNNPPDCNLLTTKRQACARSPVLLKGWHLSRHLPPTSPDYIFTRIDEYRGPLATMAAMQARIEEQFATYKGLGYVLEYTVQASSMIDKYRMWGRI